MECSLDAPWLCLQEPNSVTNGNKTSRYFSVTAHTKLPKDCHVISLLDIHGVDEREEKEPVDIGYVPNILHIEDCAGLMGQIERSPSTGKLHGQYIIRFNNPIRLSQAKQRCPGWHLEYPVSVQSLEAYVVKDDTRAADPVRLGSYVEAKKPGARTDMLRMTEDMRSGAQLAELAEKYPGQFIRCHGGMQLMSSLLYKAPPRSDVKVLALVGAPGTGKTWFVMNYFKDRYTLKDRSKWYDNQAGDPHKDVLFVDEVGPSMGDFNPREFFRITSDGPQRVETKGGFVNLRATTIVCTSNLAVTDWWKSDLKTQDNTPLLRRVKKLAVLGKGTKSSIRDIALKLGLPDEKPEHLSQEMWLGENPDVYVDPFLASADLQRKVISGELTEAEARLAAAGVPASTACGAGVGYYKEPIEFDDDVLSLLDGAGGDGESPILPQPVKAPISKPVVAPPRVTAAVKRGATMLELTFPAPSAKKVTFAPNTRMQTYAKRAVWTNPIRLSNGRCSVCDDDFKWCALSEYYALCFPDCDVVQECPMAEQSAGMHATLLCGRDDVFNWRRCAANGGVNTPEVQKDLDELKTRRM